MKARWILSLALLPLSSLGATSPTSASPEITIAAVGDLMFQGLAVHGDRWPFDSAVNALRSADLAFGNLEGPLTRRGTQTPRKSAADLLAHKQWILRGDPAFAVRIRRANIRAVSFSNNHAMDWGQVGMEDTLSALRRAGVLSTGAGRNSVEAHRACVIQVRGMRVAFLAYLAFRSPLSLWTCTPSSRNRAGIAVIPSTGDVSRAGLAVLSRDIDAARKAADIVVVSFHWGNERERYPTDYQRSLAHAAVDLGARMVLGAHPHVLQPLEIYRGCPIIYSLGNFVAANSRGPLGESLILFTRWRGASLQKVWAAPVRISRGAPRLLRGEEAAAALRSFQRLSSVRR